MTDYQKMKNLFEELKIEFTECIKEGDLFKYKAIFLHYSNVTFLFKENEEFLDLGIEN